MNIFFNFYNKKNKEENSTVPLKSSVIYWGNKKFDLYEKKKEKNNLKKVLNVVVLGCGVCPCGWGWVSVL